MLWHRLRWFALAHFDATAEESVGNTPVSLCNSESRCGSCDCSGSCRLRAQVAPDYRMSGGGHGEPAPACAGAVDSLSTPIRQAGVFGELVLADHLDPSDGVSPNR